MATVRQLGFVANVFGSHTKSTWWSLSFCKIWLDRCSGFDNMPVLTFCEFGLKCLFMPLLGVFLWIWLSKWDTVSTKPPKGTSICHEGSSGAWTMAVSIVVHEKLPGKICDEEKEEEDDDDDDDEFLAFSASFTGSAVALYCCKAHSKSIGKMENSTPCKIVTPENFILKLGTRDYVENITHHTNFHVHRFSGGFYTNRWNITLLWLFSCPVLSCPFSLAPTPSSNRETDFRGLWLKWRGSAQGWSFWG